MPKYDHLRPLAFRFSKHMTELVHRFYTLEFPQQWEIELKQLQSEFNRHPAYERNLPIGSLNQAVRALVPDLISISRYTDIDNQSRISGSPYKWLYAVQPINPEAIYLIIRRWLEVKFSQATEVSRQRVLNTLDVGTLNWVPEEINLADWTTYPNGTAKPGNADSFNLLPDWIATKLSYPATTIEYGVEKLHFRRAPLSDGSRGAELVSWPPIQIEDNEHQRWFYSVVIALTTQTVPFQSFPVMQCNFGIRRWVSSPNTFLRGGKTSVYLLTQVPWLKGLQQSNSFQVGSVQWYRENAGFRLDWSDQFPQLLNLLHPHHPFPAPERILEDPITSLNLNGSPNAAIVYSSGMIPSHGVGTGFMPVDRRMLAEQVATLIEPDLVLTEELPKISYPKRVTRIDNPFFQKASSPTQPPPTKNADNVYAKRRAIIGAVGDKHITLEVRYQTGELIEHFISHICETLGLGEPSKGSYTWETPELTINLVPEHLGDLGDSLVTDPAIKKQEEQHKQAIQQRIDIVKNKVLPVKGLTGTLVQLGGADHFETNTDPKQALRLGFAATGRLTQFIGVTDDLTNRVKSSFLDLLRQLGVVLDLSGFQPKTFSEPMNYVGIWLIRKHWLPVIIHIASGNKLRATAPGINGWLSYPELLLAIGQNKAKKFSYAKQSNIVNFIHEKIEGDILALGDTLLLCEAQNLRSLWKWLQDSKITSDQIAFGEEPLQPISDPMWQGLRVVRTRSNDETPEWYAQSGDQQGFAQGLFQINERVFASTYQKPASKMNLSPSLSKVKAVKSATGKVYKPKTSIYAWNPALYELTVACMQPGDSPAVLASLAHELRGMSLQYNDTTALPLPLHLAKLVEEYI